MVGDVLAGKDLRQRYKEESKLLALDGQRKNEQHERGSKVFHDLLEIKDRNQSSCL